MKRVLAFLFLALTLPISAWANVLNLTNQFGEVTISNSGISMTGSEITSFNGLVAPKNHSLGTVSYSTGALISGSVAAGGTFSATGSTFDVVGQGAWLRKLHGLSKAKGKVTLFSGAFSSPIAWTLVGQTKQELEYQLAGDIRGQNYHGRTISGQTTQDIYSTVGQIKGGIGHIQFGQTRPNTPEPGTLGLIVTGLVGIARVYRSKKA